MDFETLIYRVKGCIAEIRLNRPHRLNVVTQALYDELAVPFARAEADSDAGVVLLSGEGRVFRVGADRKEHKAGRTAFERRQGCLLPDWTERVREASGRSLMQIRLFPSGAARLALGPAVREEMS